MANTYSFETDGAFTLPPATPESPIAVLGLAPHVRLAEEFQGVKTLCATLMGIALQGDYGAILPARQQYDEEFKQSFADAAPTLSTAWGKIRNVHLTDVGYYKDKPIDADSAYKAIHKRVHDLTQAQQEQIGGLVLVVSGAILPWKQLEFSARAIFERNDLPTIAAIPELFGSHNVSPRNRGIRWHFTDSPKLAA